MYRDLKSGFIQNLFWTFSLRNRRLILPLLVFVIIAISLFLTYKFIILQKRLHTVNLCEPVTVLAFARNMNIGDVIKPNDLRLMHISRKDFEEIRYHDTKLDLSLPSFVQADYSQKTKSVTGFDGIIGRVLLLPVIANSCLRREYLADKGTLPGLVNLLEPGYSLFDIELPSLGFNIFLKPEDRIDLYQINSDATRLLVSNAKVILVDSVGLGQAPMQAKLDPNTIRTVSIAVPQNVLPEVLLAKKNNSLSLTYHQVLREPVRTQSKVKPVLIKKNFQELFLIQGKRKELIRI